MAQPRLDITWDQVRRAMRQIRPCVYEIPKNFRPYMRVPARLYISPTLLERLELGAIQQIINVASLPGIVKWAISLPDTHTGYGFPIGGVAAFDVEEGIISPGGIGFDINCGVRLLVSNLTIKDVEPKKKALLQALKEHVPAGVGVSGMLRVTFAELDEVMVEGAHWAVRNGYGEERDLQFIEDGGRLLGADPAKVSNRARQRGRRQLGSLGSGNHYIEVEVVTDIWDEKAAKKMGIEEIGQVVLMIHTGSRGFGHQVASDYLPVMRRAARKYGIHLRDVQLACAPFNSPEGQDYFAAMKCAANFAFCNREIITHFARQAFKKVFGDDVELKLVYDVAHNIGKVEEHYIDGVKRKLIVHRKGATRGFIGDRPEIPAPYRDIGQPILVGGSMLTGSYVLVGTNYTMEEVFGSTIHGAGRFMSRAAAKRRWSGAALKHELANKGILVDAVSMAVLAEEAPGAYKDLDLVVEAAVKAQIARKISRHRPIIVWKG